MSTQSTPFWCRRWLLWVGGGALVALVALVVTATALARCVEPYLRAQIVQVLSDRLHARVQLDSFHVVLANGLHGRWGVMAEGRGLCIWPHQPQSSSGTPLIQLDEFNFHAPLHYESGKPIVISLVHLSGLSVHVPPKSQRQQPKTGSQPEQSNSGIHAVLSQVVVERMECERAQLVLETDKPGKLPMGFAIQKLSLRHIAAGAPIQFEAQLINARPVGFIRTSGNFGPWQVDDPGASPVAGSYQFDRANLSTFRGIAGTLSSTGSFQGTLRDLVVDGEADVPDFRLDRFNSALPLHTHFHARVDGTDGDTWLDSVEARLGRAYFTTNGRIVRMKTLLENGDIAPAPPESAAISPFVGGHDILLNLDIHEQRIDDFMRFTSQQQRPLLTGVVSVKALLHIPPGKETVERRMTLNGAFRLEQALFTSDKIQSKVDELSLRGQGRPGDINKPQSAGIDSQMQAHFHMAHAVVALPDLNYTVPGADIQLKGTYGLKGGALDFTGTARMQATVSQMVGGWKGLLLRPADRFFKKSGSGALIPIQVNGTRDAPKFGLDFSRIKGIGAHPQRPGEQPAPSQSSPD